MNIYINKDVHVSKVLYIADNVEQMYSGAFWINDWRIFIDGCSLPEFNAVNKQSRIRYLLLIALRRIDKLRIFLFAPETRMPIGLIRIALYDRSYCI